MDIKNKMVENAIVEYVINVATVTPIKKTFAEAMYCGTPVVCFNKTSISEIVDHKVNGYVVDDFDALSLKDGIDWLSDQVIKKTLRPEKIQGKILNYSPEKIGLKYVELYKKILSSES